MLYLCSRVSQCLGRAVLFLEMGNSGAEGPGSQWRGPALDGGSSTVPAAAPRTWLDRIFLALFHVCHSSLLSHTQENNCSHSLYGNILFEKSWLGNWYISVCKNRILIPETLVLIKKLLYRYLLICLHWIYVGLSKNDCLELLATKLPLYLLLFPLVIDAEAFSGDPYSYSSYSVPVFV